MDSKLLMPTAGIVTTRSPHLLRSLQAGLSRAGRAVWNGLEAMGRARAIRELEILHDRWGVSDPERAAFLHDARASLLARHAPHR